MKTKQFLWIIVIIGIAIGLFSSSGSFSLVNKEVILPTFYSFQCIERDINMQSNVVATHTDTPTWYHCDSSESRTYIPDGKQCTYTISGYSSYKYAIYRGIVSGTPTNTNKIEGNWDYSTNSLNELSRTFTINKGDSLYLNTNKIVGETKLVAQYPAYGLMGQSPQGFKTPTSTSCLVNEGLAKDQHTVGFNANIVPINVPLNVVAGSVTAKSTQVVSLPDVEGGKYIYIVMKNVYQKIFVADDGTLYVDTTQTFNSDKIECIPRTPYCSDDAKFIKTPQSCDANGGLVVGYATTSDPSKMCMYKCENGVSVPDTSRCITVPDKCPAETPLFDYTLGKCVSVVIPQKCDAGYTLVQKDTKECNTWCKLGITSEKITTQTSCQKDTSAGIWILIGAILLAVVLVVASLTKKRK